MSRIVDCPVCKDEPKGSPCNNCGSQTQYGKPSRRTLERVDGTPCVHEYTEQRVSNTRVNLLCKHCSFFYQIDSGD